MAIKIRRASATVSATAVEVSHVDDSIKIGDGTDLAGVTASGALQTTILDGTGDSVMDNANDAIRVNIVAGGAGSGGVAYTDDSAYTVGSLLTTPAGGVYKSTLDAVDDGDVGALHMTAKRALHVNVRDDDGDSVMDNTNNAIKVNVVAGAGGGVSATDDSAFSIASGSIVPMGALADESAPDSVDEGDVGIPRMTLDRLLKIQIAGVASGIAVPITDNSSTISIDDGAGSITVDGTVAATQSGTWNVGTLTSITNVVQVGDNSSSLTVDNGGTFATQDSQVLADNAAFTDGTSKVWAAGYIYDEVAGTALTENDVAAGRINVNRALVSTIEDGSTRGRYATVTASNALKVDASAAAIPVTDNGSTLSIDDGAGSITVDGTVAATQSGTWNINNVSGTVSLPTGASTLAEQQTQTTALQLLDDVVATTASAIPSKGYAISGTDGTNARILKTDTSGELQVDVLTLPALAAGTNNIGDVDVLTLPALPTGSNVIGKVSVVDSVGDSAMDDANNAIRVNVVAGSSGGPSKTDDSAFSVASDTVAPMGAMADETTPDSVDEGDVGVLRMTLDRLLKIQVAGVASGVAVPITDNASTISIDDGAGSITVDGTVAISGTVAVTDNGGSLTIDNANLDAALSTLATSANQSTMITALQLLDDVVVADNAGFTDGTTKVAMAGFIYDETAGTALTENDAAAARVNANRAVVSTIEDGTTRGRRATVTASNELLVSVNNSTLAVLQQHGATQGSSLSALNAAVTMTTQYAATYGIQVTGTFTATLTFESTIDGTNWYAVKGMPVGGGTVVSTTTSTGQWTVPCQGCHNFRVRVSAYTSGTAVVSVTAKPGLNPQWLAQQTMANSVPVVIASDQSNVPVSQATASNLNAQVVGSIAHDGADSGNPVKVGAYAINAMPTSVANTDRTNLVADLKGRLIVTPMTPRELVGIQQTTITSSVTETTVVTAAASTYNDLISLTITNSSSTALIVTLKDSTAGTTRAIYALAANGGITVNFPTPMPQATANNNWTITCGTSVASIYVVAMFAKNT